MVDPRSRELLVDFFHVFLAALHRVHVRAEAHGFIDKLAGGLRAVTVEAELITDDDDR